MTAEKPQGIPVGVFPQFAVPHQVTMVLKEKLFTFSGDDFSIKDTNGVVVCRVDGKALSFSQSKDFIDVAGRLLFTLKKRIGSFRGSHEAYTPEGELLFEVQGKFKFGGSKMVASFTNKADGRRLEIEVKGEWLNMDAQMVLVETGGVLATLSRDFGARDIFGGAQTYLVQVAPGVDLLLIAALAVTFDERQNDTQHA